MTTVDELKGMIDANKDIFILDVRNNNELKYGKIKNSVLIPLKELEKRFNELPKDKIIVAYCKSGKRSETAAKFLQKKGFDAHNLKGGILAWKKYMKTLLIIK